MAKTMGHVLVHLDSAVKHASSASLDITAKTAVTIVALRV